MSQRRIRRPTAEDVARYGRAVHEAGLDLAEIRLEPDGVIRLILPPRGSGEPASSEGEEWLKKNKDSFAA